MLGAPDVFDSSLGWRFFNEKMRERTPPEHNGVTAERLVERYQISRARQDEFALSSHQRAIGAQADGFFAREIFPISLSSGKGEHRLIERDEGPRADTNLSKLASLKPVFREAGSVTAGNSSTLNDGAAVVMVCSHEYARAHGLSCLGRITSFASAGVDPRVMGIGPVSATNKLLKSSGLSISDFDAYEINEAFAAQTLAVSDLLNLDESRLNIHGGAIALGHPLGCSGARLVITMLNHLQSNQCELGLVSLCVGVGQGVSMAVQAL